MQLNGEEKAVPDPKSSRPDKSVSKKPVFSSKEKSPSRTPAGSRLPGRTRNQNKKDAAARFSKEKRHKE